MKKIVITNLIAAVLVLSACSTSPICVTSSVTPMQGKVIRENLGKTRGSDTAVSILGLYMIGRPDLDLAIKDALALKGGDTLINVSCYETFGWFLLFSTTTVNVEGEAVKFTAEESDLKGKKR
ncbi:MAG TPA: hypothetical protein PKG60_08515 [Spirochaetota bacterium]|nr:hypothetical protein [Spirochaetota bacterium]HPS87523.1 hypothetical protein [Spirochaetota bacterium]